MATVTIGSTEYDVLDTQANVESYLAASVTDQAQAFTDATADDQAKAMVEATRALQRQTWKDTVADAIADADDANIPQDIKDGFAELSAYYAAGQTESLTNASTASNQKRIKAGSVEIENFRALSTVAGSRGYRFPLPAWEYIKEYLASSVRIDGARASGTRRQSAFNKPYSIIDGL